MDSLEQAVLSGAIFSGGDPDGPEPRQGRSSSNDGESSVVDSGNRTAQHENDVGFVHPSSIPSTSVQPVSSSSMSARTMSHNTGVKGVLADYREQQRQDHRKSQSFVNGASKVETKNISRSAKEQAPSGPAFRESSQVSSSDELGDDDDDDDEGVSEGEQEAKRLYKRKRMDELFKMGSGERQNTRKTPRFGHLREIGQHQFVKATEEKGGTIVVVHVYDSSIPSCCILNGHLSSLARLYPYTKFVRALSSELEFAVGDEEDILPTLLVYKDGHHIKTCVALERDFMQEGEDELIEHNITRARVEEVLVKYGIVDPMLGRQSASSEEEDSA